MTLPLLLLMRLNSRLRNIGGTSRTVSATATQSTEGSSTVSDCLKAGDNVRWVL